MPNKNLLALIVVTLVRTKLVKENELEGNPANFASPVRYARVQVHTKRAIDYIRCCSAFLFHIFTVGYPFYISNCVDYYFSVFKFS